MFTNEQEIVFYLTKKSVFDLVNTLTLDELVDLKEKQHDNFKDIFEHRDISSLEFSHGKYESIDGSLTVDFYSRGASLHYSMKGNAKKIKRDTIEEFNIKETKVININKETIFNTGELKYEYENGLFHYNALGSNVKKLAKDIYNHVKPEKLTVYYVTVDGLIVLYNGKEWYRNWLKRQEREEIILKEKENPFVKKVNIPLETQETIISNNNISNIPKESSKTLSIISKNTVIVSSIIFIILFIIVSILLFNL